MADLEQGEGPRADIKKAEANVQALEVLSAESDVKKSKFQRYLELLSRISGVETRGIERVADDERQPLAPDTYTRIFLLWLSSALTGNNIIVGLYGPSLYGLDWNQAAACAVTGVTLGSMAVGYMSTWGPRTGNRTLIVTRFFLGHSLSKVCCVLNILTMLGYGMVNCILGGQVIHTVSGGRTAVPVGIIVVSILTWLIATLGVHLFHFYARYAWIIQILTLSIMIGCAGPSFNTAPQPDSTKATASSRLSFFSLSLASAITWAPSSADYFVYLPTTTKPWKMFLASSTGTSLAMSLTTLLGIGLATSPTTSPTTTTWPNHLKTPGTLLTTSYTPLHTLGQICALILLLGTISNNIPSTYSAALNLQMLTRHGPRMPRPLLTTLEVTLYTICAITARNYLREIVENFLPLMAYWIVAWLVICLLEIAVFRRDKHDCDCDYDWGGGDGFRCLPGGFAAGSQSYFVGPVAKALHGCDLGMWLAFAFTGVVYLPLRFVELRLVGR
ncbi:hypothetical protein BDV25DRAFT_139767 [Aspergillus avenaceus]|uniref:Permease for cytosine/purines, uracil, thiamine, allantoin-domain-containing protein n=1 Tax=Aspergillus avenaceus TaxID=36643 RepID=A0A5N6TVX4_ASPAV|nr:hypothetical protein BDV25DRAFT_139767 [Aspergillus avenaceus]